MPPTVIRIPGRQGDILLVRVNQLPPNLTARKRTPRGVVIAEGEATGHAHTLSAPTTIHYDAPNAASAAQQLLADVGLRVELTEANAPSFVEVTDGDRLSHDEHGGIPIAPGAYVAIRQIEWQDSDEPLTVAD